jgi:hypothetical protein
MQQEQPALEPVPQPSAQQQGPLPELQLLEPQS